MNKKKIILLIITSIISFSCKNNSNYNVKYINISGEIITDSLFSRMPGTLFLTNQYLVWVDPFSSEKYLHFIDLNTNKEISAIGTKGQGPNEFSTPNFSLTYDEHLFVNDINTGKQALLNIDSAILGKETYISLDKNKQDLLTRKIMIAKDKFIELIPTSKDNMFNLVCNNYNYSFGKPFIDGYFENDYNIYQGEIDFNRDRNKFIYTNFAFPYFAIYNYDNERNIFSLAFETKEEFKYQISGNELNHEKTKKGCMGLALSKDYIILQKRDYKTDDINEKEINAGQFDKLPKTVFLYNYSGELKYIVNVGMPILRISSDIKNNMLYVIGVNPEFVIMKYNLDII